MKNYSTCKILLEFGRDTKEGLKAFAEVSACRTRSSRRSVGRTMVFAVSVKKCLHTKSVRLRKPA